MIHNRWVTRLDREVVKYACPEARQLVLEAEDPLMATAAFVRGGKQLEERVTNSVDPFTEMPASVWAGIDSLRAAVGTIAKAFDRAAGVATDAERECYGEFALNCSKHPQARNILYHVDVKALESGLGAYLRHREELAEIFKKEGAPLQAPPTCTSRP